MVNVLLCIHSHSALCLHIPGLYVPGHASNTQEQLLALQTAL